MASYCSNRLNFLTVLTILIGTTFRFTSAQTIPQAKVSLPKAIAQEKKVFGPIGSPASVSCNTGNSHALRSCRWEKIQDETVGRFQITFTSENGTDPLYRYTGVGLEKGDCTMTILNLTKFHSAEWECLLISAADNYAWIGRLEIQAFEAVKKPIVFVGELKNYIRINGTYPQNTTVTCCVYGGNPNMSFEFQTSLVGRSVINLGSYNTSDSTDKTQTTKSCALVEHTFLPEDNEKFLVCNVTYKVGSQKFTVSNQTLLEVYFGPQLGKSESVLKIDEGKNVTFIVPVMANPSPLVKWLMVDKANKSKYYEIGNSTKYMMELKHIRDDAYWAKLTILNVVRGDSIRYRIIFSNGLGTQKVGLEIQIISPEPGHESEAFWLMIFIAVGATVLLVVFGIVMCILYRKTKRTGRYDAARVRYSTTATQNEEQY